jgi:hypothetical protein
MCSPDRNWQRSRNLNAGLKPDDDIKIEFTALRPRRSLPSLPYPCSSVAIILVVVILAVAHSDALVGSQVQSVAECRVHFSHPDGGQCTGLRNR